MNASVSVAPPDASGFSRARNALAELVAGREEFGRFMEGMFDELEDLQAQLEERCRALADERRRLEEQLREQAAELHQHRAELDAQKQHVRDQVRREVAEATAQFAEAMVQQRRQMDEERAQWREELTRMRQLLEFLVAPPRAKSHRSTADEPARPSNAH